MGTLYKIILVTCILALFIGVGRFRILWGGQGLEYWEGAREGGQIPSRHITTSMRRNDVASTSFRRHVPTRFLINQCQIITCLILKSDNIENSRIELKGIVLPLICQSLQIKFKLHLLLFYPSSWYICDFFLFHIQTEGKRGWIIGGVIFFLFHIQIEGKHGWIIRGGGGAKGMLDSHLKILGSLPPTLFLRLCSLSSLGSQQPVRVADIFGWRKACSVYGKGWGPARALEKTRTIPVAERSSELMA